MRIIDRMPSELLDAINNFSRKLEWSRRLPIYEIHKWWARRYSGIVRLLLIFSDLEIKVIRNVSNFDTFVENIYFNPPRVRNKKLLDPFCGGGTIVIEGSILGYDAYGIEINRLPCLIFHSLKTLPVMDFEFIENKLLKISHSLKDLWSTKCRKGHDATVIHTFLVWKSSNGQLQMKFNKLKDGKEKIYYCEKCNKIYTSKKELMYCKICKHQFNKNYGGIQYKQLVPYVIEYYCQFCNERSFKVMSLDDWKKFNFNSKQSLFKIPLLNETERLIKAGLHDFSQLLTPRQLLTYQVFLNSFKNEPYKTIAKLIVSDSLRSCSLLAYYSPTYRKVIPGFVIKSYWLPPQPVELNPLSFLINNEKLIPLGRGTMVSTIKKLKKAKEFIAQQRIPLNFKVYYGPAQDIIPRLNNTFDVVFTDPPYGNYQFYSDLSLFSLSVIREIDFNSLKTLLKKEIVLRRKEDLDLYKKMLQHVFSLTITKLSKEGRMIVTFHHHDITILYAIVEVFKNLPINLHAIYPVVGESSGHLVRRKLYLDLMFILGTEFKKPYYTFTSYSITRDDRKLQEMIEDVIDFYRE